MQKGSEEIGQDPLISVLEHRMDPEFHRLLEKLPSAAYTCDAEGLITYFNHHAVELWGRAPKVNDVEDRYCGSFKLFSSDGKPIPHDQCWMALALRENREYNGHEIVIERPDGRRLTALAHANPICDDSGIVSGAVNVLVDITERVRADEARKRAEEALREADRIKDEFLAMLAHELRNPLAPIRNAVQFLTLQSPRTPESQWAWEVIDRQMTQMVRLVDDLLDVSRITRNTLALRKDTVKLDEVVRAALEASRPLIEAGGHVLTVTATTRPVYLDADPVRLAQAISNLLNNAAKYTERGGQIWLTAEQQGSDAIVTVRDTGVGIPTEMLPHIFEIFVQVDRSLERAQGGLGIGLTLVKQIAALHGGTVQAHSGGPGKGSEFILRLPVVMRPPRLRQAPQESKQSAPSAALRILVVDDNRDSAESLSMLLQTMGNEVRTAHDGHQAVELASEFRPNVAALDVGLPKMNGYDVAKEIRQQPWGRDMILIAVTGWGQEEDKRRAMEAGFDHHMVKPVDAGALMKVLAASTPGFAPRPQRSP